ncbi:MAG: hypothetical protein Q9222_005420 [Ikaeria aurantiellina]
MRDLKAKGCFAIPEAAPSTETESKEVWTCGDRGTGSCIRPVVQNEVQERKEGFDAGNQIVTIRGQPQSTDLVRDVDFLPAMSKSDSLAPAATSTASEDLEAGFRKLAQHNAANLHQSSLHQMDGSPYFHSPSSTSYSSPELRHVVVDQYNQRYFTGGLPEYQDGLRWGLQGVRIIVLWVEGFLLTNGSKILVIWFIPTYQMTSMVQSQPKPTPAIGAPSVDEGSQGSNTSRPKRMGKKSKPVAVSEATISAPLSQLCLDVPVVDVFEKVNRSTEERQAEARKDQKIKRPSNSFMLYRSAYGDRVKALYPQNNHQIISRICGASWKMETPDITDKFKAYYEMEKENHAKAHPSYKFSPAKTSPSRKRRGTGDSSDGDDGQSDLGDFDDEYRPRGGRRTKSVKTPRTGTPTSYPVSGPITSYQPIMYDSNIGGLNPSTWQMVNPGKPMPAPMHSQMDNQYYQTTVYQRGPNIEDVFMHAGDAPRMLPSASQTLIGLPGGSHDELLGVDSTESSPSPQVDPLLLDFQSGLSGQAGVGLGRDQDFHDFDQQGLYQGGGMSMTSPTNAAAYQPAFDPWHVDGDGVNGEGPAPKGEYDWLE